MGGVVWLLYKLFLYLFRVNAVAVFLSILLGAVVYGVLLLLFKGLREEEILRFPKGRMLVALARKMRLL